ncbi:MAG: WD40 repeat protein [Parvicellaceae bacterium]|jgi:WD40 repeat protein
MIQSVRFFFIGVMLITSSFLFAQDIDFVVQTGHSSGVTCAKFNNEGRLIATGGEDYNVVLWEVESGRQLRLLNGHENVVNEILFLKSDSVLISCSDDRRIKMWNALTGEVVKEWWLPEQVKAIALNEDNSTLYCAAKDLYKIDLAKTEAELLRKTTKHPYTEVNVGKEDLIIFGSEKEHRFYQLKDGKETKGTGSMVKTALSRSKDLLFVSSKNGHISSYKLKEGRYHFDRTIISETIKRNASKSLVASDKHLIQFSREGTLTSHNYKEGVFYRYFRAHDYGATAVDFHPNNNLFVSAGLDGRIFLWDHQSGALIRELKSFSSQINFAKFSNDDQSIILGYNDGLIRIWDLEYGGGLETYQFRLSRKKIRKGWKYHVTELVSQDTTEYKFRVVLSKKYPGSVSFKECRFYDFNWNTTTRESELTERFIDNYDKEEKTVLDLLEDKNLFYEDSNLTATAVDKRVVLNTVEPHDISHHQLSHTTPITTIDYNEKRGLFISSAWDGQILLHDKELRPLARLVAINQNDFVILTNNNYYYSTKGALQSVAFAVGDRAVSFSQFDMFFNRPDIVYDLLPFGNDQLVANFKKIYEKRLSRLNVTEADISINEKMPSARIDYANKAITKDSTVTIKVIAYDEEELKALHVLVDGVPLHGSKGKEISGTMHQEDVTIALKSGINEIEVFVENSKAVGSLKQSLLVKSDLKKVTPDLYFVGIGASDYLDTNFNLNYAAKDITDVTKLIRKSKAFDGVYTKTFINNQIRKDSLKEIESFLAHASVNDVVIVYYAGHGVLNNNFDYFLGSYDMNFSKPEEKGLSYDYLEEILMDCNSRQKLIFLDACHSGEIDKEEVQISKDTVAATDVIFRTAGIHIESTETLNAIEGAKMIFADLKANTGITVISSAGGTEFAVESNKWQNGVFTYSLIHGLKDKKSGLDNKGEVTVFDLLKFLKKEVNVLTSGQQQPTYRSENIQNNFVIWR